MRVQLNNPADFPEFRATARTMLSRGLHPDALYWSCGESQDDLFADTQEPPPCEVDAPPIKVPPAFLKTAGMAALHADPGRFDLLYRLLWRLSREPSLRHDPLDDDMVDAAQLAHAVSREMHKMRAFVRFRPIGEGEARVHVAWFEPEHHIVEANAPWFARRFAQMRWAILTPRRSVMWDGTELHHGPGAQRSDAPAADEGEKLWLAYYASIFNPARLKMDMMRKEMPRRYWKNLPEAALIEPLASAAAERSIRMVERAPQPPRRAIPVLQGVSAPTIERIHSLDDLHQAVRQCTRCEIAACATQAVCGEGKAAAALMIVGEQPGDQEDLAGRPFVGPAGCLLDRALEQAGISREALYLTNAVRHFSHTLRGGRRIHKTPGQREAMACADWLRQEIALVRPAAVLAMGATAARSLLDRKVSVTQERGSWHTGMDGVAVLLTWHPSALLRMEAPQRTGAMRQLVADLASAAARAHGFA